MESSSTTRARRRRTITLILATALIVAPASAFATGGFSDVETSDFFSDAVGWMKDNKVTVGCNPPSNTRYCPDDFVTRGQMAVFLERLDTKDVFLRPGDSVDADKLDGMDSTDFATSESYQPYFVTIDGATDVTLATFGPLTLIGRCDPGTEVQMIVTSSVAGWMTTSEASTVQTADAEVEVADEDTSGDLDEDIDQGSAISPNSAGDTLYYIGYDGESTSLGLNVLGHDCVIAGVMQTATAPS